MKILVADDDAINRHMLRTFLAKWGFEVVAAQEGEDAWNILRQDDAPRLAILDWMMPGMAGPQICRKVREHSGQPYIYILLLTAKFQKGDVIAGLEAGADDYLTKPFDSLELRARLRTGQRILELQEQLVSTRNALEIQATHDSLTGLWNRAAVQNTLRTELARSLRNGAQVGVMMADLDRFKQVNDSYGHPTGDAVLREVARRMSVSVRPYDTVGRYGGEEFLLIFPGADASTAPTLAERLLCAVAQQPIHTPEGMIPMTLSLGVALSASSSTTAIEPLLNAADAALYQAKRAGRNRFEMASPSCQASEAVANVSSSRLEG